MTALAAALYAQAPAWRWSANRGHAMALGAAVAVSLGLHAVLLAWRLPPDAVPRQAARLAEATPRTMQARLTAPTVAPPSSEGTHFTPAAPVAPARTAPVPPPAAAASAPALPQPSARPAAQGMPVAESAAAAPALEAAPAPPVARPAVSSGQDDYIPRPLLSVPPAAQGMVVIKAPPGDFGAARHVGILSLFIDERGAVRHIAASEPLLPPELEQAAREAFMAARFTPGQIDGAAVKSRVQVEVVFDSTAPTR